MNWALTPIRVEAGFWLILTAGLATGLGLETDWGRQLERPVTQFAETPPVFAKPVLAEPFQLAGPDQFPDITLRPLFIVTRQPAPVAPTADGKPSMKKDQFILLGTTIVAEDKFAFLLEKAGNKSRVVAVGKEINGIMVKDVAADRVVLSQYDDREVLLLKMNRPAPGAPAPVAAPRADQPPAVAPMATLPLPARQQLQLQQQLQLKMNKPALGAPAPIAAPSANQPPAVPPVVTPPQPSQPQPQLPPRQPQAPAGAMIGPR